MMINMQSDFQCWASTEYFPQKIGVIISLSPACVCLGYGRGVGRGEGGKVGVETRRKIWYCIGTSIPDRLHTETGEGGVGYIYSTKYLLYLHYI